MNICNFLLEVTEAVRDGDNVRVFVEDMAKNKTSEIDCDSLLVCVGRRPYTDRLGLDSVGVTTDDRGRIPVNERFQTTQAKLVIMSVCVYVSSIEAVCVYVYIYF